MESDGELNLMKPFSKTSIFDVFALQLTILLLILGVTETYAATMGTPVSANPSSNSLRLWYDEPAEPWGAAMPVGCGRLGAMVCGSCEVRVRRTWGRARFDYWTESSTVSYPLPIPSPRWFSRFASS